MTRCPRNRNVNVEKDGCPYDYVEPCVDCPLDEENDDTFQVAKHF